MSAPATTGGSACPVCGGEARAALDLREYRLFACASCGSWCSDALARGADTSFTPTNYFENSAADRVKWETLHARLERDGVGVSSHLDVGCGTGAYLRWAAERTGATRQAGIELDGERARLARSENPGAEIHTGDAAEVATRLDGRTYDLITLWDVFEHVPDPRELLGALARSLSPGGRIFIQTIHENSLVPSVGRWSYHLTGGRWPAAARRTHDAHHLVFFSRRGLSTLAAASGLRIESRWFDRLALARMDGNPLLTTLTAGVLALENALGNGLFINVLLASSAGPRDPR